MSYGVGICDFSFRREGVLFLVITQRVVLISYRRFGTTYRSHSQGSRIYLTDEDIL
jgi:hypothetical protein